MAMRSRRMCRSVAGSQWAPMSTMVSPSPTSTWPRVTRFRPLAARSSVDFPDPDSPMRTEISPRSTLKEASATPTTTPVCSAMSLRLPPPSSAASARATAALAARRPVLGANRMSTLRNSSAAPMGLACLVSRAADAIEHDGEEHDDEARLEAHADLYGIERAHHRYAQSPRTHEGGNHHHRQGQHDALGDAGEDGRCGTGQL